MDDQPTRAVTQVENTFASDVGYDYDAGVWFANSHCYVLNPGTYRVISSIKYFSGRIVGSVFLIAEQVGYYHKFLASFDNNVSWWTYGPGGWKKVIDGAYTISACTQWGMSWEQVQAIREWPADAISIRWGINIIREAGAAQGYMDNLRTYIGSMSITMSGEPDGTDVLLPTTPGTDTRAMMPDISLGRAVTMPHNTLETEAGYELAFRTATASRTEYDCEWTGRTTVEKNEIETFLRAHIGPVDTNRGIAGAFVWTPPGESTSAKWISSEPEINQIDIGVWHIKAHFKQVLP